MNKYRVYVTFETFMGFSEDYFDVEAKTSMEAIDKVLKSNKKNYDIEVQSVEPIEYKRYKDQNGNIAKQISEVTTTIQDWNNDGEIYPKEGIWVEWENFGRDFLSLSDLTYLTPLD